jgi:hypothetical protein
MPLTRIDKDLIKLIYQLSPSQKMDLLIHLQDILIDENNLSTREIELYNLELDQAMQRVRDGKYTSLEELEKEMETW